MAGAAKTKKNSKLNVDIRFVRNFFLATTVLSFCYASVGL